MVLCTLLGGAVTFATTWWANRYNRSLAQRAGAFREPVLRVMLFGKDITRERNRAWCFVRPPEPEAVFTFPLVIGLTNTGDETCTDAVVLVQAPKTNLPVRKGRKGLAVSPGIFRDDVKISSESLDGIYNQDSYKLHPIHPRTETSIAQYLRLRREQGTIEAPAETKDNKQVTITARYKLAVGEPVGVVVTVLYGNTSPIVANLRVGVATGATIEEGARTYMEYATHAQRKLLGELGLFKRLWLQVRGPIDVDYVNIVHFPEMEVHKVGRETVVQMKEGNAKIRVAKAKRWI